MYNGIKRIQIDGDSWVYRAAFAAENSVISLKDGGNSKDNAFIARSCLINFASSQFEMISKFLKIKFANEGSIKEDIKKLNIHIYLTSNDRSNFRYLKAITQEYKSNRTGKKPLMYDYLRQYMVDEWGAEVIHGMEADDKLSIEAHKDPEHTLTIENDKDGRQVPGWKFWYEVNKPYNRKPYYVDPIGTMFLERSNSGSLELFATGDYQLAYQLLAGDPTDTIPSLEKGWGPRKVYNFLNDRNDDPVSKVFEQYKIVLGDEEGLIRFEETYSLVKMLEENIDFSIGKESEKAIK